MTGVLYVLVSEIVPQDALVAFEDHIRELEKEEEIEKDKEKKRTKRLQRKNRSVC